MAQTNESNNNDVSMKEEKNVKVKKEYSSDDDDAAQTNQVNNNDVSMKREKSVKIKQEFSSDDDDDDAAQTNQANNDVSMKREKSVRIKQEFSSDDDDNDDDSKTPDPYSQNLATSVLAGTELIHRLVSNFTCPYMVEKDEKLKKGKKVMRDAAATFMYGVMNADDDIKDRYATIIAYNFIVFYQRAKAQRGVATDRDMFPLFDKIYNNANNANDDK